MNHSQLSSDTTNQPPIRSNRSYTIIAAAIVIGAVVISATIFTSSALHTTITKTATIFTSAAPYTTITKTTTIFTSQTSLSECNTHIPNGLDFLPTNASEAGLALVMRPGTVAAICVTFAISGRGNLSEGFLSAKVFKVNATALYNSKHQISGWEHSYNPAPGITIVSNAAVLPLQNLSAQANITMVYTITTDANATGYYDLSYPNSCPPLIPLAVINTGQSLHAFNFPGFFFPGSCILTSPVNGPAVSSGRVTGLTGISTTWLGPDNSTSVALAAT